MYSLFKQLDKASNKNFCALLELKWIETPLIDHCHFYLTSQKCMECAIFSLGANNYRIPHSNKLKMSFSKNTIDILSAILGFMKLPKTLFVTLEQNLNFAQYVFY